MAFKIASHLVRKLTGTPKPKALLNLGDPCTLPKAQRRSASMTAFSDPDFDFKRYLEDRPRYPAELYNDVLSFHKGEHERVVDLGCGPGISLFPLTPHFKHLIGVDPSEGMIAEAGGAWEAYRQSELKDDPKAFNANVEFQQSSAEDLKELENESVDLFIAATAAHWFDYKTLWPELARVLKPKGSVAFWVYGTNYLPAHPDLYPMLAEFMSSKAEFLGPYWPQPGRSRLESLLLDVPFPLPPFSPKGDEVWDASSAARKTHTLLLPGVPKIEAPEVSFTMEKVQTFSQLAAYFRTSSASMRYYKANPEARNAKPDMIDAHVERLRAEVLRQRERGVGVEEGLDEDRVRLAWPLGLMMIRKR